MTDIEPPRRHRHRRSRVRRAWAGMGFDRQPWRLVVVAICAAVAIVAVGVAAGNAIGPSDADPSGPIAAASPSARTAEPTLPAIIPASPAASGEPSGLPAIPTPAASAAATPGHGIVAKRIRIDRLGINLRIIEGDGTSAPMNKAAHYPGTAWPHGGSNIYIYAHAQEGMFLALWDAKVGDEIALDLADGTTARYLVTQVKPKVPWNAMEYLDPTPAEQLTLQTSTSYHPTSPRFIVIAEPAP